MRGICILTLVLLPAAVFAQIFPDNNGLQRPLFPASRVTSATIHSGDALLDKIDPRLHPLARRDAAFAKTGDALRLVGALVPVRAVHGRTMLPVLVQAAKHLDAAAALIRQSGGTVTTIAGRVLVAELPSEVLRSVAASDDIAAIQAASFLQPAINVSRAEIRADAVHAGTGLPQAYTGKGVVVGVVDSGIDWAHRDFGNAGGTRIQYLWDMSDSTSSTSSPPFEYGFGREYTKAQIDAGVSRERDLPDGFGHGTHVAGTAAGNGRVNGAYTGIAPEADIVFAKGFRHGPGFRDTDVINACDWIFKRAAALGKPAVINLSLGGHAGPHDGSSLYEQSLDALVGPGRIIVAAGGNEGDRRMHVRQSGPGTADEPRVTFFRIPAGTQIAAIDIWYSGGPVDVGVAWYSPYPTLLGYTAPIPAGGGIDMAPVSVGGMTTGLVSIANIAADPVNGAGHAAVALMNNTQSPVELGDLVLALYTQGSGTMDAWLVNAGEFGPSRHDDYRIIPGDYQYSVGTPGTAKRLITVGSYVTKNRWTDVNGGTQIQKGDPTVAAPSSFSSRGPTRDGRLKPDIAAPGEAILAAMSADCGASAENILFGGGYQKMQGTSMASPHVTGTVALMLERNSTIDYAEARNALTSTARADVFTGALPNVTFGYGKLDALAAVQRITPRKESTAAPADLSVSAYPNPFSGSVTISYHLPETQPVTLRIHDALGRVVADLSQHSAAAGRHQVSSDLSTMPGGVYFFTFIYGNVTRHGSLFHTK